MAAETVVNPTASPPSLAGDFTPEPPATTLADGGTSGTGVLRAVDDDAEDTEILTLTVTDPGKVLVGAMDIELVDNDTVTYRAVRAGGHEPRRRGSRMS